VTLDENRQITSASAGTTAAQSEGDIARFRGLTLTSINLIFVHRALWKHHISKQSKYTNEHK
jgi:hypothetical protein